MVFLLNYYMINLSPSQESCETTGVSGPPNAAVVRTPRRLPVFFCIKKTGVRATTFYDIFRKVDVSYRSLKFETGPRRNEFSHI